MSFQLVGDFLSLPAAVDLSASMFCAVDVTTTSKFDLPTAGGGIVGVLVDKEVSGQAVTAQIAGVAQWKLGGTVAPKDYVKVDSSGRAVTASAGDIAAGAAVGRCIVGGNVNQIGAIYLNIFGAGYVAVTGSESIATSVDSSVLTEETLITLVTADHVGVLANGKYVGQRKRLRVISADGSHKYTLTPTTMQASQPTSFAFNRVGQFVELTWASDGWVVTGIKAAGAETVADAGTANSLCLVHGIAVTNTVAFTQPSGYVPGHQSIWVALSNSGSPVGTVAGLFYDEDGSADGVTLNYNAAADMGNLVWDGARWYPTNEVSITTS